MILRRTEQKTGNPKAETGDKHIKTRVTDLGVILDSDLHFMSHFNSGQNADA